MIGRTSTATRDDPSDESASAPRPLLVRALCSDNLGNPGARYDLEGLSTVTLRRAPADEHDAQVQRSELQVFVPDVLVSGLHARISREFGGWAIEDGTSKNGTFVNGERVAQKTLVDHDVIEIGHHFFVFLAGRAAGNEQPRVSVAPGAESPITTWDPEVALAFTRVGQAARSMVPILITGETGTGKEVLARSIHERSGRSGPLVAVNCGALPPTLAESELFGVTRGAFSGADRDRKGLIRSADKGTLFLDEIAELPESAQSTLLRALQEREVRPVGASSPVVADFRLVTATNRALAPAVEAGLFRADLLHRIRGVEARIPPVRARRCDIGLLVSALLHRLAGPAASSYRLHYLAARTLMLHDWPGNIRELEQSLAAALACSDAREIRTEHLPPALREGTAGSATAVDERSRLVALLREHHGNVAAVARDLGTSRAQVHRLGKRLGLSFADFR